MDGKGREGRGEGKREGKRGEVKGRGHSRKAGRHTRLVGHTQPQPHRVRARSFSVAGRGVYEYKQSISDSQTQVSSQTHRPRGCLLHQLHRQGRLSPRCSTVPGVKARIHDSRLSCLPLCLGQGRLSSPSSLWFPWPMQNDRQPNRLSCTSLCSHPVYIASLWRSASNRPGLGPGHVLASSSGLEVLQSTLHNKPHDTKAVESVSKHLSEAGCSVNSTLISSSQL